MAIRANVDLTVDTTKAKRSMDRAAREINKIVNNVAGKDISFNVNGKSFTQPLGRITASANEFTKSLEASNARVIAFGASVGIINAITDSFKFLVAETIRFEKTLQDINVVLNSSNEQIQKFGQGLFDVAQNTAQSFNVAAEAALEFSRQGLSVAEVLKRTNDALTLTRITSLDAAEAVSGLTAAVNAFGEAGLTTTDIIDKLAAVDVKFAVSSEDLINGLERAGAVAIDAGVELDSLVGIITSLQQTTARGGAVIGNGLKTIFTRIQRPESIRQLEDMGVAVRTLTGAVLPADKVLQNIAKSFEELSQSQQSNIVQFAAGIFQANIFRAALADLSKAQGIQQQATEISANAAGEAARKNELLNKSISAMASQAGTGLKELVGIMGELAIKPELGDFVSFFGARIEELKNSLGGGEDEGNAFAKGLVRGIGNVLTGPGVIAFAAIFSKLLFNVFKFASGSLKDVLGIVTQKEKVRQIEESIVKVLGSNVQVTQALNRLEGDRVAQEQYILGLIEAQTNALAKQQQLASKLGPALLKRGITPDLSYNNRPGTLVDIDGDGSFRYSGLLPEEKNTERKGAIEGGYSPGRVAKMKVPGMGEVIYNTAEKVKNFEGMKQPAIMPPQSSRAGRNYKEKFSKKHGFDPYASGGFIPNFAQQIGNTLLMQPSKFLTYANSTDIAKALGKGVNYRDIERKMDLEQPVSIKASLLDIITSSDKNKKKPTGQETLYDTFNSLASKGIAFIERDFLFRPLTRGGARKRKGESKTDFAERKTTAQLNAEQAIRETAKSTFTKYLSTHDPETNKGDASYPIDHIAKGLEFPSGETKSGEFIAANLISKSLRMASDRELTSWLESQGGKDKGLNEKNLKRAQNLASQLGIKGTRKDKSGNLYFGQEDADIWGMNKGFVPNFITVKPEISDHSRKQWNDEKLRNWKRKYIELSKRVEEGTVKPTQGAMGEYVGTSATTIAKHLLGKDEREGGQSLHLAFKEEAEADEGGEFKEAYYKLISALQRKGAPEEEVKQIGKPYKKGDIFWKHKEGGYVTGSILLSEATRNKGGYALSPFKKSGELKTIKRYGGEAFSDTFDPSDKKKSSEVEANDYIQNFGGIEKAFPKFKDFKYDYQAKIMYPYKEGKPLSKLDFQQHGVIGNSTQQAERFEALINIGKHKGGKAPLDFINPNGEAKFTSGGIEGQKNFNKDEIGMKILRSEVGNNKQSFKSIDTFIDSFKKLQNKTLETNLFLPAKYKGLIPNFASTTLYRGTSPRYQKAVRDIPNPPQFLFDEIMAAKTKSDFIKAVKKLGISHSMGAYSGSYNDGIYPATIEQMRGYEEMGENQILHGGYVYPRPMRGGFGKQEGVDLTPRHQPSGFVSRTVDKDVARDFAKSMHPGYEYDPNEMGNIEEVSVPNKRIFDQTKLEKYIDRFGLENVKKSFKQGMRKGTLKDIYLNLHKFRPKVQSTDPLDMFSPNAGESDRSIGMSGGSLARDEQEITHIWSKRSPYFGQHKGLIPNFNVNLSNGYHDKKAIEKAIGKVYKSKTGSNLKKQDLSFAVERYISAIKDKQADDSDGYISSYPGGHFTAGGQKFNFNEISMALLGHGQFHKSFKNKGFIPNFAQKIRNGAIYHSKSNNKAVRVKRAHQAEQIAYIKHHGQDHMFESEVPFSDLIPATKEQIQEYLRKKSAGLIPNFFNLNRRNLSDKDKMSDRQLLLKKWQDKMSQIAPYAKQIKQGGARAEIDPIISKLNAEANAIWDELQKLKKGKDYYIPNFNEARKVHEQMFGTLDSRTKDIQNRNKVNREKALRGQDPKLFDRHYPDPILGQTRRNIINAPIGGGEQNVVQAIRASKRIENSKKEELIKQIGSQKLKDLDEKYLNERNENSHISRLRRFEKQRKDLESAVKSENFEKAGQIRNADFIANEKIYNEYASYLGATRYLDSDVSVAKRAQERFGRDPHSDSMNDPSTLGYYPGITKSHGTPGEKTIYYNPYKTNYVNKGPRSFRSGGSIPNLSKGLVPNFLSWRDRPGGWSPSDFGIPNFVKLNRKNLSDKDKMFDRKVLVKKWQDKMGEIAPYVKQLEKGGARIEIDPIISKLNEDANRIWDELQKLRRGEDYYIPNLVNPLQEAIHREKSAGVPSSRIKIEKSSQLKSPMNPMGLAVTNTRDEPGGIAQGIRRAKKQGIDPKRHGIDVPNFATPVSKEEFDKILKDIVSKAESSFKEIEKALDGIELEGLAKDIEGLKNEFNESIKEARKTGKTKKVLDIKDKAETIKQKGEKKLENNQNTFTEGADANKKIEQLEEATKKLTSSIEEADVEVQRNTKSQGDNLVKLFALQSVISTANGFLQEYAESTNMAARNIAKFGSALSDSIASVIQIKMLGEEIGNFAQGLADKQQEEAAGGAGGLVEGAAGGVAAGGLKGKTFAFLGGLKSKAVALASKLGPLAAKAALVVGGFKLVDGLFRNFVSEDKMGLMMTLFGSSADKAAHRLELMSKSIESTTAAIENLKKQEENKQKIAELEIKGSGRTIKEDQQLLDLRVKSYDLEVSVARSMAELQKETNESGFAMRMFSEATKKAGKATLDMADLESMLQQMKVFEAIVSTNETFANTADSINDNNKLNDAAKSRGYGLAMLTRSLMDENQAATNQKLFDRLSKSRGEPDNMLDSMNFGLKEGVSQEDFRNVFKRFHDNLEESENFPNFMDEDEAFRQGMQSFIDAFKKNDLSEPLKKLIQSNSEAIKELDRRVVIEKHLSKIRMSAAKHESALSKIINKQTSQRSKFLDEQNLIAKSTLLKEKQTLALADIENTASLSTTNAREKLNQAFLDVADKVLRTENLSEINAESLETALANLNKDLSTAGNKIKNSANTFEKINKGLDPDSQIQATDKDKIDATAIVNATKKQVEEQLAAIEKNPAQVAELQKIFTDLYSRLAAAKNENVTALVLSSLEILKLNEEQIQKTRKAILEKEQEIDTANKAKAIAQKELSLQMENENLTAKTLDGNKALYNILKRRVTDSKTLAKQIEESTMFDMQLNDAKKEELKLRQEIINDLTAQAVVGKIGKNTTELRENQSKTGLLKADVVSLDPSLKLDGELLELRETNVRLLADKVTSEYLSLSKTNKENELQQALIDVLGLRKRTAEQKFTEELSSLRTQIQEKAARISLLKNDENARNTLGQKTLINEIADTKIAELTSQAKLDAYGKEKLRLALAESQVQSELNELKSQRLIEETKFQVAANNGKLLETVQEELKLETSMLEKDAYLAALKSEQAQLLEGINERQKKAQELLDFSNKIDEARLAANKASMDQRALSGIVDADMQINRFNQRYDTRAAATQAINPNATAEDMLAFTEKLKEFNKTTNNGTEAIDALRVKMAEMQVSASNLKSDLVNTGIENLRTNMVQMFKDIGSGAKSVGDAYRDLGLGLAEAVLDRMMQHNVDKIISNLTYAFTGVDPEQEANKFLLANNDAVSANTSALEKLRGQLMKGITPPPPPEFSKEPTKETAEQIKQDRINNTFKPLLENLDIKITDFTNVGIGFVESLSGAFEKIRQKLEQIKSEVDTKVDPVTNDSATKDYSNVYTQNALDTMAENGGRGGAKPFTPERIIALKNERIKEIEENLKTYNAELAEAERVRFENSTTQAFGGYGNEIFEQIETPYGKIPEKIKKLEKEKNYIPTENEAIERSNKFFENKIADMESKLKELPEGSDERLRMSKDILAAEERIKRQLEKIEENKQKIVSTDEQIKQLKNIEKNNENNIASLTQKASLAKAEQNRLQEEINKELTKQLQTLRSSGSDAPSGNGIPEVPTKKQFWGGKIQHFAKGGLVKGPGGIDNVPAMLTAGEYVVPKEEVQNFSEGGRATRFLKGATQAAVMTITADAVGKAMEDQSKKKGPPTFNNKKLESLKLNSDLSFKTGDPRLSGRNFAKDPVMQEYGDFLIEKAAYERDKKNEKFNKKMGYFAKAIGFATSFAIGEITSLIKEPLKQALEKAKDYGKTKLDNVVKGHIGFGDKSDAFKNARQQGYSVNYKDVEKSFQTGKPISFMDNGDLVNLEPKVDFNLTSKPPFYEANHSFEASRRPFKGIDQRNRNFLLNNLESSYENRALRKNSGGKIPSMLTRGEGFIPSSIARRIGYQNLETMNRTGSMPTIQGPSGIDKVGPVGLDEGDFIIRKSSTDKLMRDNPNTMRFAMQNPDGFRRGATGYYEGGIVGTGSSANFALSQPNQTQATSNEPVNRIQPLIEPPKASGIEKTSAAQNNEITNNINVNVTIDSSGKESVEAQTPEGSFQQEQELAMKIKTRVLEVIREEKRLGGELDR